MFTWKPIYRELAETLMGYSNRQHELLAMIKAMQQQNLPVISLKDQSASGAEIDLAAIDPFTFFTNFNRGTTEDSRRKMLAFLKERFGLSSPVPSDFHGIPVTMMLKSWFFPYSKEQDRRDIPALWDLASACLVHPPDQLNADLFKRCLDVKQVGAPKLTMGLFWLNPDSYLALDSVMVDYLESKGIQVMPSKVASLFDYTAIVEKVRSKVGTDYPQISWDAYLDTNRVPATTEELDAGLQSVLRQMAERNHVSIEQVAAYVALQPEKEGGENEVTNRLNIMPEVRDILSDSPINLEALRKVSAKLWVLANGQDATRRNAFFKSGPAADTIAALLDEASGLEEMERIDTFITTAAENGYTDPKGRDASGAAQFTSVLMSAKYPDHYVDFRGNRWNKLFALVLNTKKQLCTGSSYAWKIIRAGKLASALAITPTFKKYFGSEHGAWKVAGLAWRFKDGIFDMEGPMKRYWAGGFLRGGTERKLDEFLAGNYWQHWYSKEHPKGAQVWELFDQIKPGDELAIKGYGGRNDLIVHYVGEVREVKSNEGMVTLNKLDRKLFHGQAPKHGGKGTWFGTLLEVADPDAVQKVFFGKAPVGATLETFPLNLILYGPPGTGKTYQSTHKAVQIIDGRDDSLTPAQLQHRFDELVDEGRISFITFHQSYAYEDFIEGIRPVLSKDKEDGLPKYECRDGLFKKMAIEAMYAALEQPETSSKESEFDARWTELLDRITENPEKEYEGLTEKTRFKLAVSSQGNVAATNLMNPQAGPFNCSRVNLKKVFFAYADRKEVATREVNETLGVGNHSGLAAVLFRELQSIEFSKGQKSGTGRAAVSYEERKQIVLDSLEQLETSGYRLKSEDKIPRFVLVVDEINRGNISKILGELVTLLEPDKRIGAAHQLRPVLPYSAEIFGVPQNLFVLGTMNTADKSIALVDVALRRRFQFEELMPDLECCELLPSEMRRVIDKLNARITLRKDRDHQIGHSYFMDVSSPEQFNEKFTVTIIPLLQEYFYNDWDGLRFVFAEEKTEEDGHFIRRIPGADTKWVRNKWQWYTDAGDKAFDCLGQLLKNYGFAVETGNET